MHRSLFSQLLSRSTFQILSASFRIGNPFCWSLTLMRSVAVLMWRRFNYATFHLFVMMSRNVVVKADVAGPSVGVIGQAEGYCSRIRINAARATADGYSGWPAHSKPTQNVSAWLCVQSAWLCVQSAWLCVHVRAVKRRSFVDFRPFLLVSCFEMLSVIFFFLSFSFSLPHLPGMLGKSLGCQA